MLPPVRGGLPRRVADGRRLLGRDGPAAGGRGQRHGPHSSSRTCSSTSPTTNQDACKGALLPPVDHGIGSRSVSPPAGGAASAATTVRWLLAIGLVVVSGAMPSTAWAYWSSEGGATGSAKVATLAAARCHGRVAAVLRRGRGLVDGAGRSLGHGDHRIPRGARRRRHADARLRIHVADSAPAGHRLVRRHRTGRRRRRLRGHGRGRDVDDDGNDPGSRDGGRGPHRPDDPAVGRGALQRAARPTRRRGPALLPACRRRLDPDRRRAHGHRGRPRSPRPSLRCPPPGWSHAAETVSSGTGSAPTVTYRSGALDFAPGASTPAPMEVTGTDTRGNARARRRSPSWPMPIHRTGGALTVNGVSAEPGGAAVVGRGRRLHRGGDHPVRRGGVVVGIGPRGRHPDPRVRSAGGWRVRAVRRRHRPSA